MAINKIDESKIPVLFEEKKILGLNILENMEKFYITSSSRIQFLDFPSLKRLNEINFFNRKITSNICVTKIGDHNFIIIGVGNRLEVYDLTNYRFYRYYETQFNGDIVNIQKFQKYSNFHRSIQLFKSPLIICSSQRELLVVDVYFDLLKNIDFIGHSNISLNSIRIRDEITNFKIIIFNQFSVFCIHCQTTLEFYSLKNLKKIFVGKEGRESRIFFKSGMKVLLSSTYNNNIVLVIKRGRKVSVLKVSLFENDLNQKYYLEMRLTGKNFICNNEEKNFIVYNCNEFGEWLCFLVKENEKYFMWICKKKRFFEKNQYNVSNQLIPILDFPDNFLKIFIQNHVFIEKMDLLDFNFLVLTKKKIINFKFLNEKLKLYQLLQSEPVLSDIFKKSIFLYNIGIKLKVILPISDTDDSRKQNFTTSEQILLKTFNILYHFNLDKIIVQYFLRSTNTALNQKKFILNNPKIIFFWLNQMATVMGVQKTQILDNLINIFLNQNFSDENRFQFLKVFFNYLQENERIIHFFVMLKKRCTNSEDELVIDQKIRLLKIKKNYFKVFKFLMENKEVLMGQTEINVLKLEKKYFKINFVNSLKNGEEEKQEITFIPFLAQLLISYSSLDIFVLNYENLFKLIKVPINLIKKETSIFLILLYFLKVNNCSVNVISNYLIDFEIKKKYVKLIDTFLYLDNLEFYEKPNISNFEVINFSNFIQHKNSIFNINEYIEQICFILLKKRVYSLAYNFLIVNNINGNSYVKMKILLKNKLIKESINLQKFENNLIIKKILIFMLMKYIFTLNETKRKEREKYVFLLFNSSLDKFEVEIITKYLQINNQFYRLFQFYLIKKDFSNAIKLKNCYKPKGSKWMARNIERVLPLIENYKVQKFLQNELDYQPQVQTNEEELSVHLQNSIQNVAIKFSKEITDKIPKQDMVDVNTDDDSKPNEFLTRKNERKRKLDLLTQSVRSTNDYLEERKKKTRKIEKNDIEMSERDEKKNVEPTRKEELYPEPPIFKDDDEDIFDEDDEDEDDIPNRTFNDGSDFEEYNSDEKSSPEGLKGRGDMEQPYQIGSSSSEEESS